MKQQQKHYFALLYSIGLLPLVLINSREWTEKGENCIRKFYELDLNLVIELLKDNQSEKIFLITFPVKCMIGKNKATSSTANYKTWKCFEGQHCHLVTFDPQCKGGLKVFVW